MISTDLVTIKTLRQLMSDEEILVCEECGSPRLERKVWVDCNTDEIYDDVPETEVYCSTCERHINVLSTQTLKKWKSKDTVYCTREEAIQDLAESEADGMPSGEIIDILIDGCPGWKAMAFSNVDLINFYETCLGKKLVITTKKEFKL